MKTKLAKTLLTTAVLLSATSVQAALLTRLDGQAVYDTDLNITWLTNANLAASNTFGMSNSIFAGAMSWLTAQSWIGAMNSTSYLGYNDWRLPNWTDTGTPGCNPTYSGDDCGWNVNTTTGEMAHLFYDELANKAYYDTAGGSQQPGWGLTNIGPFINLHPDFYWYGQQGVGYWTGTTLQTDTNLSMGFSFDNGGQGEGINRYAYYAMVVRSGDVALTCTDQTCPSTTPAAVPVPAAAWLFGSGLLGLVGVNRRKAA